MASSALTELDHLTELFQDAASSARAAANVLDSIVNLHRKAHDVMDNGATQSAVSCPPSDAVLDRLGGKTHLLAEVGAPDSGTRGRVRGPDKRGDWSRVWVLLIGRASGQHASDSRSGHAELRGWGPKFNDFFDSPAAPQAQPYPPSILDLNAAHDTNFYLSAEYQPYHHHHQPPLPPQQAPFEQAAPILDAT